MNSKIQSWTLISGTVDTYQQGEMYLKFSQVRYLNSKIQSWTLISGIVDTYQQGEMYLKFSQVKIKYH